VHLRVLNAHSMADTARHYSLVDGHWSKTIFFVYYFKVKYSEDRSHWSNCT